MFGGILQAESLSKKYEEKYKQVSEIASKLTVEEAKFRDIQGVENILYPGILYICIVTSVVVNDQLFKKL
jgi:hypothetical protein